MVSHEGSLVSSQADQEDAPESTYQAQFDTVEGEWTTVSLPWHEFVPVKRAQVGPWKESSQQLGKELGDEWETVLLSLLIAWIKFHSSTFPKPWTEMHSGSQNDSS